MLDPTYGAAPRAWGLVDPLTDQSIAGGALWSMGDLAYIVAGLALVGRWLLRQSGPRGLPGDGFEGPEGARREPSWPRSGFGWVGWTGSYHV